MLVAEVTHDHRDNLLEIGLHGHLAALARLRDGHEGSVPVLPVGGLDELLDLLEEHGHHQFAPERDRQPVNRLLANIVVGDLLILIVLLTLLPLRELLGGIHVDLEHHR